MARQHSRIPVTDAFSLEVSEVEIDAMRARGAGGQNVNKVSSAVHLRLDINEATLPERVRSRLRAMRDSRITQAGSIVIRADRFRTQARNRQDALERLVELLREAAVEPRRRVATKPTRGSQERRLKRKDINSKNKQLRKKPKVE